MVSMSHNESTHVFALYYLALPVEKSSFVVHDEAVMRRIVDVLRLRQGERVILFNRDMRVDAIVEKVEKKSITISVQKKQTNSALKPSITLALPILKKEAFEEAVYAATEIGATSIQPIITSKVHRELYPKEHERLTRIIISAAELSKNFSFPELREPMSLDEYLKSLTNDEIKIFCDPQGTPAYELLQGFKKQEHASYVLMIGPEGDLTHEEKMSLQEKKFLLCALTPTILRAQQAVTVALGILRSCL